MQIQSLWRPLNLFEYTLGRRVSSIRQKMPDRIIEHVATIFPVDPDVLKGEATFARRRSIALEFALHTSTHGLPGIARAQTRHNRLFWTISLLIFTGIMLYFVVRSIQDYFRYPTQTLVSLVDDPEQPFAAVTICKYSAIRFDRFMEPFINYTNERNLTNTTDITVLSPAQFRYGQEFLVDHVNRNQSVEKYFYSLDELLIGCTYNSMNCSAADFVSFQTPTHRCYTFNAKTDRIRNGSLYAATDNGEDGTLRLRLYSHSHQYVLNSIHGSIFL